MKKCFLSKIRQIYNNFHYLILQRGLVVGVYIDDSGNNVKLTPAADQINQESGGAILKALKM